MRLRRHAGPADGNVGRDKLGPLELGVAKELTKHPFNLAQREAEASTKREILDDAVSVVLEKVALGLADAPSEPTDGPSDLVERAITERAEQARDEKMIVRARDASKPWTDYTVASAESGRTYRVALRSEARGDSYCSCPDFRKHTRHV